MMQSRSPLRAWQILLHEQAQNSHGQPSPTEQLKSLTLQLFALNGALLHKPEQRITPKSIRQMTVLSARMANLMNVDLMTRVQSAAAPASLPTTNGELASAVVTIGGRMSKAMEATDHFENYPSRTEMEAACVDLASLCLSITRHLSLRRIGPSIRSAS